MEERKGFLNLCNLLHKYKREVTLTEIIRAVAEEGWYNDFLRIGYNSIVRQINNHNAKYGSTKEIPYDEW